MSTKPEPGSAWGKLTDDQQDFIEHLITDFADRAAQRVVPHITAQIDAQLRRFTQQVQQQQQKPPQHSRLPGPAPVYIVRRKVPPDGQPPGDYEATLPQMMAEMNDNLLYLVGLIRGDFDEDNGRGNKRRGGR